MGANLRDQKLLSSSTTQLQRTSPLTIKQAFFFFYVAKEKENLFYLIFTILFLSLFSSPFLWGFFFFFLTILNTFIFRSSCNLFHFINHFMFLASCHTFIIIWFRHSVIIIIIIILIPETTKRTEDINKVEMPFFFFAKITSLFFHQNLCILHYNF